MKKALLLFIVMACVFAFASTSHAWIWSAYPLNGDEVYMYDRYSWDGWNHTWVYYNNWDLTATQIIMDPDGAPFLYYYGVFNYWYYTLDIYYSYDGWTWYYYGWFYI
jgi:hypothetical protein